MIGMATSRDTREGCLEEEAGSDGDSRALTMGPCCAQLFTRAEQERAFWERDANPARVRVVRDAGGHAHPSPYHSPQLKEC